MKVLPSISNTEYKIDIVECEVQQEPLFFSDPKFADPAHSSSTSQAAEAAPSSSDEVDEVLSGDFKEPGNRMLDAAFEALADEKRREVDLALHGKISEVSIDGKENETKESGWTPFY